MFRSANIILFLLIFCGSVFGFNPFASEVIDISLNGAEFPSYKPGWGYYINNPDFKDPASALGNPDGSTTEPAVDSCVSLGGFGGQIVLAFDHDVENNAANPMGLDAIVFGNAFWYTGGLIAGYEYQYHWAEFGTIEIMPELNGNNVPGDAAGEKWYLIAGSSLSDGNSFKTVTWDKSDYPMLDRLGMAYPNYAGWPAVYQTSGYELFVNFYTGPKGEEGIVVNPNFDPLNPDANEGQFEGYWGYADYSPTVMQGDRDANGSNERYGDVNDMDVRLFYTNPDDPFIVGMTAGAGGGDAFDIDWAVDEDTWQPAHLSSFRYIRITTAVDNYFQNVFESSTEVDAVSDVRPMGDVDGDGDVDIDDLEIFCSSWLREWGQEGFNAACDMVVDNKVDMLDYELFCSGWRLYVLN